MSPLLRATSALFVSAVMTGCATAPAPYKPDLGTGPDGCTIIDKNTGRILSMPPIECYAQRQLEAEAKTKKEEQLGTLKAAATISSAIIKQPVSKDNPQAQNMGTVLAILKMEEMAKNAGLDDRSLKETLPGGWSPRMIENAARLVRATFEGRCSRDVLNKQDLCWDGEPKEQPKAATPAPAPAAAPAAKKPAPTP